jgi:hypothetical protein
MLMRGRGIRDKVRNKEGPDLALKQCHSRLTPF